MMHLTRRTLLCVERSNTRWFKSVVSELEDSKQDERIADDEDFELVNLELKPHKDRSLTKTNKTSRPALSVEEALSSNAQRRIYIQGRTAVSDKWIDLASVQPDYHSTAFGKYLEEIGIHGAEFERFVERNPRAFHLNHLEVKQWRAFFYEQLDLSDNDIRAILIKYPKILLRSKTEIEAVCTFLKNKLVLANNSDLRQLLVTNPLVVQPGFLRNFGQATTILFEQFKITMSEVNEIVEKHPQFLTLLNEQILAGTASIFMKLLRMNPIQVGRLIQECPRLLSHTVFGLHERLVYLLQYGLSASSVQQMVLQHPSLLDTRTTADLRHVVNYLEAALDADTPIVKKIIFSEPSVLKMNTETEIAPNIGALQNLGFSIHDCKLILVRCPRVLTLSLHGLETERKVKFLKRELEKDLQTLITYPNYLCCSMTECLLPRVEFLKSLHRVDYKEWPLMKLFGETDDEFCTRHVRTLPEKYANFYKQWKQNSTLISVYAPEAVPTLPSQL